MSTYKVTIIANVNSSLSNEELESMLVVSLYDIETNEKTSDGENRNLHVVDYELTEAIPI